MPRGDDEVGDLHSERQEENLPSPARPRRKQHGETGDDGRSRHEQHNPARQMHAQGAKSAPSPRATQTKKTAPPTAVPRATSEAPRRPAATPTATFPPPGQTRWPRRRKARCGRRALSRPARQAGAPYWQPRRPNRPRRPAPQGGGPLAECRLRRGSPAPAIPRGSQHRALCTWVMQRPSAPPPRHDRSASRLARPRRHPPQPSRRKGGKKED